MKLGIGGGAFGVRGGISTRGIGVGVGPFSSGTSWRGKGSGGGGLLAWLIVGGIIILVVAWPYLLGTWVAVQSGAWNPSTERFVVGWMFETVYIAALVLWLMMARHTSSQRAAEEAQTMAKVIASGDVYETKNGRSVVYRHGTCTVNHRSPGAASNCPKSSKKGLSQLRAAGTFVDTAPADGGAGRRQALVCSAAVLAVGLVVAVGVLIADPIHSAAEEASAKPCPPPTTTSDITVPDLVGQNAETARTRLTGLGLTRVELSSANPDYKSVLVASNWTVVSTDPAPGCFVNRHNQIIVYVTK